MPSRSCAVPPPDRQRSVTDDLVDLFKEGEGGGGQVLEQVELEETQPMLLTEVKKNPSGPVSGVPPRPTPNQTLHGLSDPKKSPKV